MVAIHRQDEEEVVVSRMRKDFWRGRGITRVLQWKVRRHGPVGYTIDLATPMRAMTGMGLSDNITLILKEREIDGNDKIRTICDLKSISIHQKNAASSFNFLRLALGFIC